jgi:hypothetical protein
MSNILSIITLLVLLIAGGFLGWLTFTGKTKIGDPEKVCQPAPLTQASPPQGVVLKDRAVITLQDERFSIVLQPLQKTVYLRGPIVTLVINSTAQHPHNFVIAFNSGNCQGDTIRKLENVYSTVDNTLRLSLKPGEYLIYCDLKDGARTHREKGEELRLIVY